MGFLSALILKGLAMPKGAENAYGSKGGGVTGKKPKGKAMPKGGKSTKPKKGKAGY